MKKVHKYLSLVLLATLPIAAMAQEEEEKSKGFIYATYFYCDAGGSERVDEITKKITAPKQEQGVKDGIIQGWGWLAHHTGGLWRRAQYFVAPTLNELLDAQEALQSDDDPKTEKLAKEFAAICRSHQDYIWERKSGGSGDAEGTALFSVYYVCDETREERADEIFEKDFGPIFDKFVADKKISNWGWNSHWVGGEYRRLQTISGTDHKSLLAARGELITAMYGDDNEAGKEFNSICGSHEDYMWDIQMSSP